MAVDRHDDKQRLPTPRTDDQETYYSEIITGRDHGLYWVKADFARQLERELAVAAKRYETSERTLDRVIQQRDAAEAALSARSAVAPSISREDLETALNIALATLGHFNTEQTDQHWNEQERVLREIEKRMRSTPRSSEAPTSGDADYIVHKLRQRAANIGTGYVYSPGDRAMDKEAADIIERLSARSATATLWQHVPVACHNLGINFLELRDECERLAK